MSSRTLYDRPLIMAAAVTAAGTNRATATQLSADWNRVTSVPTDGAGVKLLPALPRSQVRVVRADYTTTNKLAIHASGTDGIGPGFDVVLLSADHPSVAEFFCIVPGVWEVDIDFGTLEQVSTATLAGAGVVVAPVVHNPTGVASPAGVGAVIAGAVLFQRVPSVGAMAGHGVVACVGPN